MLAWLLGAAAVAAAPDKMQAIVQTDAGLVYQTVPTPQPAAGEILVRVHAAAVNPVDWKRKPPIPGFDVAGVIEALGSGVTGWKVGQSVVARAPGGYAQYAIAPAANVILKPSRFTFEEASGMPVAGVAAYRAAREAKVVAGQRVAIIGAAGGSGSVAVQVTKALGARVIAVGHSSQQAFLETLGADEFVAYDQTDVAARIRDVDAVLNMVDGQATASLGYVKRGGHFASISGAPAEGRCEAAGVGCVVIAPGYVGISDGDALRALAALAEEGRYKVTISRRFPLAEAAAAQQLNRTSDTTGKIVLIVDPAQAGKR